MYNSGVDVHEERSGVRVIDLRCDTVTKPTNEMRAVMSTARVGDDFYGEDPPVNGFVFYFYFTFAWGEQLAIDMAAVGVACGVLEFLKSLN